MNLLTSILIGVGLFALLISIGFILPMLIAHSGPSPVLD